VSGALSARHRWPVAHKQRISQCSPEKLFGNIYVIITMASQKKKKKKGNKKKEL
jgi:hypothetical protein